jgi:Tfp pilus assembly protein PilV
MVSEPGRSTSAHEAGFSLIEALIAALILLFIALGLIPLFARSLRDNTSGNDSTQASNHGKAKLEEYLQLPFNNQSLALAPASTSVTVGESWAQGDATQVGDANEGWWAGAPAGRGKLLWSRQTVVRQYGITDLDDGKLGDPLPGGTEPVFVHLKEVEVRLESEREPGNPLGGGRVVTFRMVKPF